MELLISEIDRFVSGSGSGNGYGSGSGYGSGYGYGSGNGNVSGSGSGNGNGSGSGNGSGYGYGSGYGSGNGYGILQINGFSVCNIDNVPTIIESVHGNYAKGYTLNHNVLFKPCYIAKYGDCFAHGKTLKDAVTDAKSKYLQNTPIDERIEMFHKEFPDYNVKVDANRLFEWHNILTGSCRYGREQFCKSNGIDYENGKYSVNEFIDICKGAYGWENVRNIVNK